MNNSSMIYKIHPVKDLKLRKYAIIGFILVSFAGIVSFLWVPDISIVTPLLYAIYILITLYILRFAKVDIFSPLMFFIFLSFLGFGFSLSYLSNFPDQFFFINPFYAYNFKYDSHTMALAFMVFLIGYISYIFGFNIVKRGIKLSIRERKTNIYTLIILGFILIISSYLFRSRYHVGVPGYYTASIPHAGYLYYPLMYGSLIITGLILYSALRKNSTFYTIIGLSLFGLDAILKSILGWKGGPVQAIIIILSIYYYTSRYSQQSISKNIKSSVIIMILILIIFLFLIYPIVTYYRSMVLIGGGQANLLNFVTIFKRSSNSTGLNFTKALSKIQGRISGINNLLPIVAYFQQNIGETIKTPSFFLNLLKIDINPEQYYTWFVLGVNPKIITTNAPTGWGALYIYGGIIGVIIGMFILGTISKFLYLTFLINLKRDGRWIVFYAMFICYIFIPVVFSGTIINYCRKNLLALIIMYGSIIFILNIKPINKHIQKGYLKVQRRVI